VRALSVFLRLLGLDELARLVDDGLAARDLRRVGEHRLELLLAQPAAGDAGRLVGLGLGVEEAVMTPLPASTRE
jgi:hypothetical protein